MRTITLLHRNAVLVLVSHSFATYHYTVRPTEGISMAPTLAASGDWVLISKYHRRGRGIEFGDVVSFASPMKIGERAIKRVLGMPGDYVQRDTYNRGDGKMIQVPEGHCWLVGDNVTESRDSRLYGPVPLALIRGKVVATVFPPSNWGWMKNGLEKCLP